MPPSTRVPWANATGRLTWPNPTTPEAPMRITPAPILPPLPEAEYRELRDSIRLRGVLVPLMVTADGMLIDGHERWRAVAELGIREYPLRVVGNLGESERRALAVRLNVERRHLTPAQKR